MRPSLCVKGRATNGKVAQGHRGRGGVRGGEGREGGSKGEWDGPGGRERGKGGGEGSATDVRNIDTAVQ